MKSKLIYRILIPALVLVVGLVMFFTLGFNKTPDVAGYQLIEVNIVETSYADAKAKVDDVLKDKNVCVISYGSEQNDYGDVLTVKFTAKNSNEEEIKSELIEAFGYDQNSLIEQTYVKVSEKIQGVNLVPTFAMAGLGILIGFVCVFVYVLLRQNLANAFSILLSAIIDVLMMLSLVVITRVPVSSHFGIALVVTALFSSMMNVLYYDKLVSVSKDEKNIKLCNQEVISIAQREFVGTLIVLTFATVIAIAAFSYYNLFTSLAVVFGIISVICVSQFIVPHFWALAYKRKFKAKKVKTETEAQN